MRYWIFWIERPDDPNGRPLGEGWVRAETMDDARKLIGHPDMAFTQVPDDSGFPVEATGAIYWEKPLQGMAH